MTVARVRIAEMIAAKAATPRTVRRRSVGYIGISLARRGADRASTGPRRHAVGAARREALPGVMRRRTSADLDGSQNASVDAYGGGACEPGDQRVVAASFIVLRYLVLDLGERSDAGLWLWPGHAGVGAAGLLIVVPVGVVILMERAAGHRDHSVADQGRLQADAGLAQHIGEVGRLGVLLGAVDRLVLAQRLSTPGLVGGEGAEERGVSGVWNQPVLVGEVELDGGAHRVGDCELLQVARRSLAAVCGDPESGVVAVSVTPLRSEE